MSTLNIDRRDVPVIARNKRIYQGTGFSNTGGASSGGANSPIHGLSTDYIPIWDGAQLIDSSLHKSGSGLVSDANYFSTLELINTGTYMQVGSGYILLDNVNAIIAADSDGFRRLEFSNSEFKIAPDLENMTCFHYFGVDSIYSDAGVTLGTGAKRYTNVFSHTLNVDVSTLVSNLNADLLDGQHGSFYATASGYIPYTGATTNVDLGQHDLTIDTSVLFVNTSTHMVGVGTTTPITRLTVNGSIGILGQRGIDMYNSGGSMTGRITNQADRFNMFGYWSVGFSDYLGEIMRLQAGKVGIGTISPSEGLHVVGNVRALQFKSDASSGTSPLTVNSSTLVTNLNADLLDGKHATSFMLIGASTGVTSVGLALPSIFNVTNSPCTSVGTLTGTLVSQTAGTVFAAPTDAGGVPSFRFLASTDIPALPYDNYQSWDCSAGGASGTIQGISSGGSYKGVSFVPGTAITISSNSLAGSKFGVNIGVNLGTGATQAAAGNHTHTNIPSYAVVPSDVSTSNTTGVDITGLVLPVVSGGVYAYEVNIMAHSTDSNGCGYGIALTGAGSAIGSIFGTYTVNSYINFTMAVNSLYGVFLAGNIYGMTTIKGIVRPTSNCNFSAQHKKYTSGVSTVLDGTFMRLTRIS